jgi:hypothetical protein
VKRLMFNTKVVVRRLLLRFPRVYLRIAQLRHQPDSSYVSGAEALRPNTEVLIAGLPRSGNSFAVNAFRLAQDRAVHIAHHEYPPAQIVGAARHGIPALLVVRNPDDVAVSRVASHPPLTLKQALADYIQCHKAVVPWREHFVLATFPEVTGDFGLVIRRLNEKYGTDFREFNHTEENVRRAFELIDERYRSMGAQEHEAFARTVARPSREREEAKALLFQELASDGLARLRSEAWRVFHVLTGETSGSDIA